MNERQKTVVKLSLGHDLTSDIVTLYQTNNAPESSLATLVVNRVHKTSAPEQWLQNNGSRTMAQGQWFQDNGFRTMAPRALNHICTHMSIRTFVRRLSETYETLEIWFSNKL